MKQDFVPIEPWSGRDIIREYLRSLVIAVSLVAYTVLMFQFGAVTAARHCVEMVNG